MGGSICLESSVESREYMFTYFWEMGTYFYWGDGSIFLLGEGLKTLATKSKLDRFWPIN